MKTRIFSLFLAIHLLCVVALAQGFDTAKLKELEAKANGEPNNIDLWLQFGRMQFMGTRGGDTALLEAAQESFEHILQVKPEEPRALAWHGMLLSMKAGKLFQSGGKMEEAQKLLAQGFNEMDRAVEASPNSSEIRRLRGETNLRVPEFLGRTALGVEDFEIFIVDPSFDRISPGEKAESYLLLGTGYSRLGKPELAEQMWQKTVTVAPESNAAKEAKRLLSRAALRENSSISSRPDRLTEIPDDVGPIMAVASIVLKPGLEVSSLRERDFDGMMQALKSARGFMGVRLLRSSDNPPMYVIVTWWENRTALVDWYYNPAHQKMIKSFSFGNGSSSPPVKDMITHIGIQFYSLLRGGGSFGESFGPRQKPVE